MKQPDIAGFYSLIQPSQEPERESSNTEWPLIIQAWAVVLGAALLYQIFVWIVEALKAVGL